MLERQARIAEILGRLRSFYPRGFAIALHAGFGAPRYLFQAYAPDWIEIYSRLGLVLQDPSVRWAAAHTGAVRWSALAGPDGAEMMALAARHGLRYGFSLSIEAAGTRSMAGFARTDREATTAEIEAAGVDFAALHRLTIGAEALMPQLHARLKEMSIYLTRG